MIQLATGRKTDPTEYLLGALTHTAEFYAFAYNRHSDRLKGVGFFVVTFHRQALTLGNKNNLPASCEPPRAYLRGAAAQELPRCEFTPSSPPLVRVLVLRGGRGLVNVHSLQVTETLAVVSRGPPR